MYTHSYPNSAVVSSVKATPHFSLSIAIASWPILFLPTLYYLLSPLLPMCVCVSVTGMARYSRTTTNQLLWALSGDTLPRISSPFPTFFTCLSFLPALVEPQLWSERLRAFHHHHHHLHAPKKKKEMENKSRARTRQPCIVLRSTSPPQRMHFELASLS